MAVATISAREVFERRRSGERVDVIDVRTPVEYAEVHAEGVRLVPLDALDPASVVSDRLRDGAGVAEPLYVICKSGGRAAKACAKFHAAGFPNVLCIDGGTAAWEQAGLPVVRGARRTISLERQVRICAGSVILIGAILGAGVHPGFWWLSAFVGAGLVFAGVSDWCGMGILLSKMPWNRRVSVGACSSASENADPNSFATESAGRDMCL